MTKDLTDTNRAESMLFRAYYHGNIFLSIIRASADMASQLEKIKKLLVSLQIGSFGQSFVVFGECSDEHKNRK